MPNLRELLLQTRDLLDERESSTQYEDYQLRRWLDEGQTDLVLRNPAFFTELLTEATGTTSNGVSDYATPADFLFLYGARLDGIKCRVVDWRAKAEGFVFGAHARAPEVALVDNEDARFYPTPGAGTPAYAIWYIRRPHDLFQQIATMEDTENWTGAGVTETTSNLSTETEGGTEGILLTAGGAATITAALVLPAALDLDNDTTDVIEVWCSTNQTNVTDVRIQLHTAAGVDFYSVTVAPTAFAAGGTYIRIPKSRFTATGSPAWTNINEVRLLLTASAAATVTFDDFRVYRSPEVNPAAHRLLCTFAAAKALEADEGMRQAGEAANLMTEYGMRANQYLGMGGKAA